MTNRCEDVASINFCPTTVGAVTYYVSNNNCCKVGTYWDTSASMCVALFDTNCSKSQDGINCELCSTGTASTRPIILEIDYTSYRCKRIVERKTFYPCMAAVANNRYLVDLNKNDTCKTFDFTAFSCTTCLANHYKTAAHAYCCADGKTGLFNDCVALSTLMTGCNSFDYDTRTCKECSTGKNL